MRKDNVPKKTSVKVDVGFQIYGLSLQPRDLIPNIYMNLGIDAKASSFFNHYMSGSHAAAGICFGAMKDLHDKLRLETV